MPDYVISKVMDALNTKGKSVNGSKVLILGIAYKKNVDDMRESPSVELSPATLSEFDCVLVATDHDKFDWEMIEKNALLIVDTRGKYTVDNKISFRA